MVNFQGKEIKEENLVPCYFFYGEETFLAWEFANELKEALISPDIQDYGVERFNLEDNSWAEVIDSARALPIFISPWRIIVVEVPKGKKENLSSGEESILKDYFSSPPSKTVIIIVFSGKIKKNTSLFKFFSSISSAVVSLKELKYLKEKALYAWMDKKFLTQGKTAELEAKIKLQELVGNDLRRVSNEIEKLITFVGEKKVIELDDVNQVSGWVKTFFEWEIADSLGKADFERSLIVLNNLFKEGVKPEYILGSMAKFFRDIFLAKLLLKEKSMDRKAIFKELRPHIQEKFGNFYASKFKEFFSLVEKFSMRDLSRVLAELEEVDLKMKTTSITPQTLLESFLFDYCALRKKERVTWRERRD
ncbi:MAG: DNA polymerase III subunit delta [Candidatus Aminicenantes bacterium]|nr:DNA polymerase III subunit delta [Candidatus Aminicenantes bacterium]